MVVLDASGSMAEEESYAVKFDTARSALNNLTSSLAEDAAIGLIVYGTKTGHNTNEKERGCSDVTLVSSPKHGDREWLGAEAEKVLPRGYSPMGLALQQAANALNTDGPQNIVLITDGFDVCETPDPCETAAALAAQHPGLAISVLPVRPQAKDLATLRCIAEKGGGHFNDPESSSADDELRKLLNRGFQRPAVSTPWSGTEVSGSAEPGPDTPAIVPGDYLDQTFTRGTTSGSGGDKVGTVRYYRLPVPPGMTPWVSAQVQPDSRPTESQRLGLRLTLVDDNDNACLATVSEEEFVRAGSGPVLVVANVGGVRPGTGTWSKECSTTGPLFARVERLGEYQFGTALPVRLQVRFEPGNDQKLSTERSDPPTPGSLPAPTPQSTAPVLGDNDFPAAPILQSGSTISDTIVSGEVRRYAVRLGWGQRLSYRLQPTSRGTPMDAYRTLHVSLRNPLAAPARLEVSSSSFSYGDENGATGSSALPIAFTHRSASDPELRAYSLPGLYYLSLSLQADEDPDLTVAYALTIQVAGQEKGGPSYSPAVAPESVEQSAAARTTVSPTMTSADPSAGTALPGWLWLVAGAAAALVLAAAIAGLTRRRARHR